MKDFITRKFEGHESAQAWVWEYDDGHKTLVSYSTIVADCDAEGWVHIYGLYSATTRKHIGWFMRELGLDYQTARQLHDDCMKMNIHTGEVVDFYA